MVYGQCDPSQIGLSVSPNPHDKVLGQCHLEYEQMYNVNMLIRLQEEI